MIMGMLSIGDFVDAPDTRAAGWVVDGLRGFGESVVSVVPAGFAAYARIFHPAQLSDPSGRPAHTPVRWREVAAANGRTAHPQMQWPSLVGSWQLVRDTQPGLWDVPPEEGSLPADLADLLPDLVVGHTTTPERCWFGVWDGFGASVIPDDAAPAFHIPQRRMWLLAGPVGAIRTSVCHAPWFQSANLWWPDDRTWCVATEIDFMSTYVGGSRDCVQALVDRAGLEAVVVEPGDGIAWASDLLNPSPI
jgi:hypothetical protein